MAAEHTASVSDEATPHTSIASLSPLAATAAAAASATSGASASGGGVSFDSELGFPFSPLSLEAVRASHRSFSTARAWGRYHTPRNLLLALVGEVGELAEVFQWKAEVTEGVPELAPPERTNLEEELSDCLLYLVALADRCHVDLAAAVQAKMIKNAAKYPAERVFGSSKKYNLYEEAAAHGAAYKGAADHEGAATAARQVDQPAPAAAATVTAPIASPSGATTAARGRPHSPLPSATITFLAILSLVCVALAPSMCEATPLDLLRRNGTGAAESDAAALTAEWSSVSPSSSPSVDWPLDAPLSAKPDPDPDPASRNATLPPLSDLASLCHLAPPLATLPFLDWDLTLPPYWLLAVVDLIVVLGGYAWTWVLRRTQLGRWLSRCCCCGGGSGGGRLRQPAAARDRLHMQFGGDRDPEALSPHFGPVPSGGLGPRDYSALCEPADSGSGGTQSETDASVSVSDLVAPPPRDTVFDEAFTLRSSFMIAQLAVQVAHAGYVIATLHPAQSHWNRYEELLARLLNGGAAVALLPWLHATMLQPPEEGEGEEESGRGRSGLGARSRGVWSCWPGGCGALLLLGLALPALLTHALPGLIFFPIWLAPLLVLLLRALWLQLADWSPARGAQLAALAALDAQLNSAALGSSASFSMGAEGGPVDPEDLAELSRLYLDYEVARDFGSAQPPMSERQRALIETAYGVKTERARLAQSAQAGSWLPTHVRLLMLAVLHVTAAAALSTAVNYAIIFYRGRGYMDAVRDEWYLRASGCYQHGLHAGSRSLVFSFFAHF